VQHIASVPAAEGLFLQPAEAFERLVLEGELERGAHVRLELSEQREGLVEQLSHPPQAVGRLRFETPHRGQRLGDDGAHQRAAAREVPIGGGARHSGSGGHLGH
jgi:hypothetical protein